jgi:hypothetical protein
MRVLRHPGLPAGDLACASGLFAVGVFVVTYGLQYPLRAEDGSVGPGLMPMVAGTALAITAAVLLGRALSAAGAALRSPPPAPAPNPPAELSVADFADAAPEPTGQPITVAGILGMLIVAVLLAPTIGLIPMLGALVFVCVLVFERQGWIAAAIMTVLAMACSWLLFVRLFEVPVPYGTLWKALGY